eukprot:13465679-Alexandrium_andersonii.AAC.1
MGNTTCVACEFQKLLGTSLEAAGGLFCPRRPGLPKQQRQESMVGGGPKLNATSMLLGCISSAARRTEERNHCNALFIYVAMLTPTTCPQSTSAVTPSTCCATQTPRDGARNTRTSVVLLRQ